MRNLKVYTSPTCQPCKMLYKMLKHVDIPVEVIDISQSTGVVKQENLKGVPTLDLLDASGELLKRHVGFMNEEQLVGFIRST